MPFAPARSVDLNFQSTRHEDTPRVVVYQFDKAEPLNPRGLLIAYEEEGRVLPVASDFDAFTLGSKGLQYPKFPKEQHKNLESLLRNIERILSTPGARGWSHRWLEVLKGEINRGAAAQKEYITSRASMIQPAEGDSRQSNRRASYSGVFGKKDARQGEPRYGFGDEMHYSMIKYASEATKLSGAVRHAAECYNFYWPQDLDDEFLVVWQGFKGTPWRHFNPKQLREFLTARAADGFVFPLNPKWLLCDEGWYDVYQAMLKTPDGREAINAWVPAHIQKQIAAIRQEYPTGFQRVGDKADVEEEPVDFEILQLHLSRHIILRRAKLKLRSILLFNKMMMAAQAEPREVSGSSSLMGGIAQLSHRMSQMFTPAPAEEVKSAGADSLAPAAASSADLHA